MKKLSALCCALFFLVGITSAQLRKLPSEVTNAFAAKYPDAKNVSWKDNLTNFIVQFDQAGDHTEVKFNSKGEWLEATRTMHFESLSAPVKDGFNKSKFTDWQKKEIKELQVRDKATLYRFYMDKGSVQKKYLYFNAQGQLVRDALTL